MSTIITIKDEVLVLWIYLLKNHDPKTYKEVVENRGFAMNENKLDEHMKSIAVKFNQIVKKKKEEPFYLR